MSAEPSDCFADVAVRGVCACMWEAQQDRAVHPPKWCCFWSDTAWHRALKIKTASFLSLRQRTRLSVSWAGRHEPPGRGWRGTDSAGKPKAPKCSAEVRWAFWVSPCEAAFGASSLSFWGGNCLPQQITAACMMVFIHALLSVLSTQAQAVGSIKRNRSASTTVSFCVQAHHGCLPHYVPWQMWSRGWVASYPASTGWNTA